MGLTDSAHGRFHTRVTGLRRVWRRDAAPMLPRGHSPTFGCPGGPQTRYPTFDAPSPLVGPRFGK